MKLHYFEDPLGNFGDDLNPWLFAKLFPNIIDNNENHLLVGVGTILNHRIPLAEKTTIFGSGYGYGSLPNVNENWFFSCVRGPLTAAALGLPAELAITDPAVLSPLFFDNEFEKCFEISYMPHCHSAFLGDWKYLCDQVGIHFIDPRHHFLKVFAEIKKSKRLVTEAMHGAILADAFRVPWLPAKAYPHICEFKWQDWLNSVEVSAEFNHLPPLYRGDELYKLKDKVKNKIKRLLISTPIWNAEWAAPPPIRSSQKAIDLCAEHLLKISNKYNYYLSCENKTNENIEKLLTKAENLRKRHAD